MLEITPINHSYSIENIKNKLESKEIDRIPLSSFPFFPVCTGFSSTHTHRYVTVLALPRSETTHKVMTLGLVIEGGCNGSFTEITASSTGSLSLPDFEAVKKIAFNFLGNPPIYVIVEKILQSANPLENLPIWMRLESYCEDIIFKLLRFEAQLTSARHFDSSYTHTSILEKHKEGIIVRMVGVDERFFAENYDYECANLPALKSATLLQKGIPINTSEMGFVGLLYAPEKIHINHAFIEDACTELHEDPDTNEHKLEGFEIVGKHKDKIGYTGIPDELKKILENQEALLEALKGSLSDEQQKLLNEIRSRKIYIDYARTSRRLRADRRFPDYTLEGIKNKIQRRYAKQQSRLRCNELIISLKEKDAIIGFLWNANYFNMDDLIRHLPLFIEFSQRLPGRLAYLYDSHLGSLKPLDLTDLIKKLRSAIKGLLPTPLSKL